MKNEDNESNTVQSKDCVLTALDLGNFKAFAETQHLPIKPLTLIFGANSSGKSSLIHSLLLANHALANGNVDVHQPKLAGQSVDLGGFHEFVHQHEAERGCTLAFALSHKPYRTATWFNTFNRTKLIFEIGRAMSVESGKQESASVGVRSFLLEIDDLDFLRTAGSTDGSLRVVSINLEHPYFARFFAQIDQTRPVTPDDALNLEQVAKLMELKEQSPAWAAPETRAGYEMVLKHSQKDAQIRTDFTGHLHLALLQRMREIPLRPGNLAPISTRSKGPREQYSEGNQFGEIWEEIKKVGNCHFIEEVADIFCFEVEELLDWINAEFSRCLNTLTYLGPLRYYPPRHLVGMHDEDPNWFSGGGHAWKKLRDDGSVREKVNHWLSALQSQSAGYEIRVRHLKDLGRIGDAERKRLADRLQQVGTNNEPSALAAVEALLADLAGGQTGTAFDEVVLFDKRTGTEVSHRDVGVGISQVLPVLVHAYADQNQIVAIEQPEIHLHPALQAELGDVFIESALGERRNTFILETHSEHLILRIMRRMRETHLKTLPKECTPITQDDVAVLFVETDGARSIVREMPLNEIGELVKAWPGGFFEEAYHELFHRDD